MTRIIFFLLCVVALSIPAHAESLISTAAKQAIVVDYDTGMVLYEKNADERMPTSSMSKTMTVYAVFEALKKGDLKLDDAFTVSEKAWRKGGSKMFVEVGKQVKIDDLLQGVIVQSGNDATIVLAEGLGGSEEVFARSITEKAHELGMDNTHFANASGWPDPNHYSTARDLATLAAALIRDFPGYYHYFSEKEFTYSNITQKNRNPLLYRNIGADGVKTGHTEDGGYGLIGSGVYEGRRVIVVLNGMANDKERAQESAKVLEWGLRRFENRKLFGAGEPVENIPVAMGKAATVTAVLKDDLLVSIPKIALKNFTVNVRYKEPLIAPVRDGQEIGSLEVDIPYIGKFTHALYAANDVAELGFFSKTLSKMKRSLLGGQ